MPKSAIEAGQVDLILPLDKIAPALVALCGGAA
jgi:chemotaxis response regulator CheB